MNEMREDEIAEMLHDFADRLESGEYCVTEVQMGDLRGDDEMEVKITGMPREELMRMRKAFD